MQNLQASQELFFNASENNRAKTDEKPWNTFPNLSLLDSHTDWRTPITSNVYFRKSNFKSPEAMFTGYHAACISDAFSPLLADIHSRARLHTSRARIFFHRMRRHANRVVTRSMQRTYAITPLRHWAGWVDRSGCGSRVPAAPRSSGQRLVLSYPSRSDRPA